MPVHNCCNFDTVRANPRDLERRQETATELSRTGVPGRGPDTYFAVGR
jgi:hypothetical protein